MKAIRGPVPIFNRSLLTALALLGPGVGAVLAGPAAGERTTFADSVRELPAAQKATLHTMTAAHLTDKVGFNIPLALRNQTELEERVNRGEVISGAELKERYFPLQEDYDTVAAWLKSEGFTVDTVADTNLAVFAHGTVAQVRASFQTEMGLITADGADRAVALAAPSLPAAVARPALGVSGLSYRRPHNRLVHPDASTPRATGVPSGGYHISQLATAYSGTGLSVNGTTLTGAGQTIAIEAYVQVKSTDLSTFWSANGITRTGTVTTINVNNATLATDNGDIEENALDVEWASGMAPGANVVDYATNYDTNDAPERIYNRVITDASASGSTIHELSSSYGPTEAQLTATELSAYNQIFISLTAAGCTYINATGDVGSSPVEAYGVFPYTFGVGGTSLNVNTTTFARATETGWSGSSGGVSANYAHPTWQTGTGTIAADKRQFPDIALAADPSTPAYFVYSGKVSTVGGTSWSAPTFAGFLALIHQGRALNTPARGGVGFLNPRIYPLIDTTNFFDVLTGSNTGYSAGTGYDMVTGVGVPNISTFLATLLGPTITGFTPTSGPVGTTVTITGTNFYANGTAYPVAVSFGGTAATSVTVTSATQLTAVVPSGAATGAVVVTSFGDTATSGTDFTVPRAGPHGQQRAHREFHAGGHGRHLHADRRQRGQLRGQRHRDPHRHPARRPDGHRHERHGLDVQREHVDRHSLRCLGSGQQLSGHHVDGQRRLQCARQRGQQRRRLGRRRDEHRQRHRHGPDDDQRADAEPVLALPVFRHDGQRGQRRRHRQPRW